VKSSMGKVGSVSSIICGVLVALIVVAAGIGGYIYYVVSNASGNRSFSLSKFFPDLIFLSVPTLKFLDSNFQINRNASNNMIISMTGNISVSVDNQNKVALTLQGADFPAFWPANASGSQVGTFKVPSTTVPSSTTQTIVFDGNMNNVTTTIAIGIAMEEIQFNTTSYLVNGTSSAGFALLGLVKGSLSFSLSCILKVGSSGAATPNCSYSTGSMSVERVI
jgi:hypothetical protein